MHILFIAFIIVLWWIGIWGLVETLIHHYVIDGSVTRAVATYSFIILFVLLIAHIYPDLFERFA